MSPKKFTCDICFHQRTKKPKDFTCETCSHTICKGCAIQLYTLCVNCPHVHIKCPFCREQSKPCTIVPNLPFDRSDITSSVSKISDVDVLQKLLELYVISDVENKICGGAPYESDGESESDSDSDFIVDEGEDTVIAAN